MDELLSSWDELGEIHQRCSFIWGTGRQVRITRIPQRIASAENRRARTLSGDTKSYQTWESALDGFKLDVGFMRPHFCGLLEPGKHHMIRLNGP